MKFFNTGRLQPSWRTHSCVPRRDSSRRLSSVYPNPRHSLLAFIACLLLPLTAYAADPVGLPKQLQGVGIDQHLNAAIPLDVPFTDQDGNPVQLKKYFGSKPVLFAPVYFTCPMLCNQILSGLVAG